MHCLLLGCGDLGSRVGELLLAENFQVWGARRSLDKLPQGIQPLAWTLPEEAPPLPQVDYLVYCLSADEFSPEAYRLAYLEGVEQMINSLKRQKVSPKRIFFVSSTGVYAQKDGEEVDETSETRPESFSGQLLLQGEEALYQAPWPVSILRFSGIYGPGRERLLRMVKEGRFPAEQPLKYSNRIHIEDGARALVHLIQQDAAHQPLEDTYLISDCEPAPLQEVTHWLAHQLGVLPQPGEELPSRGGNKRINSQRLKATGFNFRYPSYREGYAPLLKKA
ncbi:Nucleoside-diphosphate-sugar epimerase [Marinospirillum celere]|uniref:Nucleoside-diphosphate-sugar epimerase n=1 Tax=Marinospirillum celere TaxID=1122252 RepID=A0A1I1JH68_9GAMM|nr:SDR family oxidoreductase [Marinospirillum celere]SFC47969.1 Nucleoside-diphosphate-sugar epimerase [Marinospirillum celere]